MSKKIWIIIAVIVVVVIAAGAWSKKSDAPSSGANQSVTVNLETLNKSGQSGNATITPMEGKVKVVLNIDKAPTGSEEPAHIHKGACPTPGAVLYPLNSVVNGTSETIIDASMDDLAKNLPLAINIHKSPSEINQYVACGNIPAF